MTSINTAEFSFRKQLFPSSELTINTKIKIHPLLLYVPFVSQVIFFGQKSNLNQQIKNAISSAGEIKLLGKKELLCQRFSLQCMVHITVLNILFALTSNVDNPQLRILSIAFHAIAFYSIVVGHLAKRERDCIVSEM